MFKLYEEVRIKKFSITGTIVDISNINGIIMYVIGSDIRNISSGYGGDWKLIDCHEDEIEKI